MLERAIAQSTGASYTRTTHQNCTRLLNPYAFRIYILFSYTYVQGAPFKCLPLQAFQKVLTFYGNIIFA